MSLRLILLFSAGTFAAACREDRTGPGAAETSVPALSDGGTPDSNAPDPVEGGSFGRGQVDRDGHPLVSLLLVPGALRDQYNAQSSFDLLPRILQDALASRLVRLDSVALGDGGPDPLDWPVPDGGTHPLLPIFLTDALLVDTSLSCGDAAGGFTPSYLDLDREAYLLGAQHTTCGGRTPSEDVVDKTLTLLVTGDRDGGPRVTQGLTGPTKPSTTHFPYLAEPN